MGYTEVCICWLYGNANQTVPISTPGTLIEYSSTKLTDWAPFSYFVSFLNFVVNSFQLVGQVAQLRDTMIVR